MSRKEKIMMLNTLKEGKITIDSLQAFKVYFFRRTNQKIGVYELDGKELNQHEYDNFCINLRSNNDKTVIWNELKTY